MNTTAPTAAQPGTDPAAEYLTLCEGSRSRIAQLEKQINTLWELDQALMRSCLIDQGEASDALSSARVALLIDMEQERGRLKLYEQVVRTMRGPHAAAKTEAGAA